MAIHTHITRHITLLIVVVVFVSSANAANALDVKESIQQFLPQMPSATTTESALQNDAVQSMKNHANDLFAQTLTSLSTREQSIIDSTLSSEKKEELLSVVHTVQSHVQQQQDALVNAADEHSVRTIAQETVEFVKAQQETLATRRAAVEADVAESEERTQQAGTRIIDQLSTIEKQLSSQGADTRELATAISVLKESVTQFEQTEASAERTTIMKQIHSTVREGIQQIQEISQHTAE